MYNGKMFSIRLIRRIDGFHTAIQTQDKIIEIQTKAKAIRDSNLLIELIKLKLSSWLIGIVAQGPNISSIYESCAFEFPKSG